MRRRDAEAPYLVRIPPLVLFLLATVFGAYAGWQHVRGMMMSQHHPDSVPLAHGLAMRMPYWYAWALLVPLLQWLARRYPLERMRWMRGAAIQLVGGVAIMFLHSGVELGMQRLLPQWPFIMGNPYPRNVEQFVVGSLGNGVGTYAILLCGVYCAAYYARYRERELAASQLQGQLAHAQLQALRMQLNPHFLFNALNSISMLVRGGQSGEAVRMLAGLGDLLRGVLEEERPNEVPLREELDFLTRYLAIEQIRADRLQVRMVVAPELMDARVPNLILQPLVENAIRHGIARSSAAGLVEIGARRENGALLLSVRDDGPGLSADGNGREGVGLTNTRARLARMYGDEQGLEMVDAEGGGTLVTIRLPHRTGPVEEAAER
ncbi:MAG TPA: sensor histidine kinase [Longimicrobium sp.]|jgi:signal transduction histidine kinase|nr:sensor histidine kinase [Longimicrobium sp.]